MSNPKISLEDIVSVINGSKIDPKERVEIIKELNAIADELAQEKADNKGEKKPKGKFVVLIKSDDASLQAKLAQGGYIIQVADQSDTSTLYSRIQTAARSHNDSCKRPKNRVNTFPEAMEKIKRKYSKEQNYLIKTKLPVEIQVVAENNIV